MSGSAARLQIRSDRPKRDGIFTESDQANGNRPSTPEAIEDRLNGDGAATEKTGYHAEEEGAILLIEAVENSYGLEQIKTAEGYERDSLRGLLAPKRDSLRNEEQAVDDKSEAEENGDEVFHSQFELIHQRCQVVAKQQEKPIE